MSYQYEENEILLTDVRQVLVLEISGEISHFLRIGMTFDYL